MIEILKEQFSSKLDLHMIFLYQCERCHAVMKSSKYVKVQGLPAITYITPTDCVNCRDANIGDKSVVRHLPSNERSLRAKCRYTSCEVEFNALPRWVTFYYTESEFPEYQPVLIETDIQKIKRLIPDWQNRTYIVSHIQKLENSVTA